MRHVILTRPAQEAGEWAASLEAAGHRVSHLPLIATQGLPWRSEAEGSGALPTAIMFVSPAAVRAYLANQDMRNRLQTALERRQTRLWVTGSGTAKVLIGMGFPESCIDQPDPALGRIDSEGLWGRVQAQLEAGFSLCIVRGKDHASGDTGRPWLAEQARMVGAQVQELIVYERSMPLWDAGMVARACQAAQDGSIWLLSSSRAIENLRALMPHTPWKHGRALATHPRVALAAREAGFGTVVECGVELSDVLASIESNDEFGSTLAGT